MTRNVILAFTEGDEESLELKAGQVGADILSLYRALATTLREKGWAEATAMGRTDDPSEHAARHLAFQLYGAAAWEIDAVIGDLLEEMDKPGASLVAGLSVIEGGRPASRRRAGGAP